jgi:hypothetical protein
VPCSASQSVRIFSGMEELKLKGRDAVRVVDRYNPTAESRNIMRRQLREITVNAFEVESHQIESRQALASQTPNRAHYYLAWWLQGLSFLRSISTRDNY